MSNKKWEFLSKNRLFKLMNTKEKMHILNNLTKYNLNLEEKLSLIKSLNVKNKFDALEMIFKFYSLYGILLEETYQIFKKLSYPDKLVVLELCFDKDYQKELILHMNKREHSRMLLNWPHLLDTDLRDNVIDLLTESERISLYKIMPNLFKNEKLSLLKKIPEPYIKNFLDKNKNNHSYDVTYIKNRIVCSITSDYEKLSYLTLPNVYNIKLNDEDRIRLICSLSDDEKLKFITNDNYMNIYLEEHDKIRIIHSVSDEKKITYLKSKRVIDKYFGGNPALLIRSISSNAVYNILLNHKSYKLFEDESMLVSLIVNQSVPQRKALLNENNLFNIKLSEEGLCQVIISLPQQIKVKLIKENSLKLTSQQFDSIMFSLRPNVAIMLLIENNFWINDSSKVGKIIEKLSHDEVAKIMLSENTKLQEFVNKYLEYFILCLSNKEKIKILNNSGKYKISLTDVKKISLINSINWNLNIEEVNNIDILACFDNPSIAVNYFLNNLEEFKELNFVIQKQIVNHYSKELNLLLSPEMLIALLNYVDGAKDILANGQLFNEMLKKLGINMADFIQYGINSQQYNIGKNILKILQNNDIMNFLEVKNYFFLNYYPEKIDSKCIIENFLELLDFYCHYRLLCLTIINTKSILNKTEKELIYFLIHQEKEIDNLTSLEDVENIRNDKMAELQVHASNSDNLFSLKNSLLKLLFLKDYYELLSVLNNTGGVADLEILKFNNRHNLTLVSMIDDVLIVTDLMERIINTEDIEGLKRYLSYFTSQENFEHTKKIINYCSRYIEYIKKLYEFDFQCSLTKISRVPERFAKTKKAIDLKKKYGGEVIDLSQVNYALAAHVKSQSESVESLLKGTSSGTSNFISVSAISHRGQQYYFRVDGNRVIFAYDSIPNNSFICSSTKNLGSNYIVQYHSSFVPEMSRNQRGILEISECDGNQIHNSEILLFREGLIPCGIIVPDGTTPSRDAIECHKKYKLPFIITQKELGMIENPEKVTINDTAKQIVTASKEERETLQKLKTDLVNLTKKKAAPRKFAVLADPHALYEPTLACLLDIKKKGIDEIYSLGDNIGHGPSPKETLDLLSEFGVKSVYGNHELYLEDDGIENFKDHFPSQSSLERTQKMVKWIKQELTDKQIDAIKKYPQRFEINSETDTPLTLIHTTEAYNYQGLYSIPPEIKDNSYIIQGHNHFASNVSEKNMVLRAVGIGQTVINDGMAAYAIVEVNDKGYQITTHYVPYNRNNLLHTINESTMPISAKRLIKSWVNKIS